MNNDSLGDRMKRYERAFQHVLPQRMPIVIRVDGRAFHTLLSHCERPWDPTVERAMNRAATSLCEDIQGAELAYVQSDEISILIHPYKRLNSEPWFAGELQKIVSVSAALATCEFNEIWNGLYPATFDSRAFVLPEADVCNYFLWRQQDATRNSVQMLARVHFSHKECHNKNNIELQDMLVRLRGVNWNNIATKQKRGRCISRDLVTHEWVVRNEIPIFSADRDYINKHLKVEEE